MNVYIYWQLHDDFWYMRTGGLTDENPFCGQCPCQFDTEMPDYRVIEKHLCVHLTQRCEHRKGIVSDYVPMQFVCPDFYDNYTGRYR